MRIKTCGTGLVAIAVLATAGQISLRGQNKADEILAATRKAIGSSKPDAVRTLSLEAKVTRNAGNFQMSSDVEMQLEMPDKYWRSDSMSSPMNFQTTSGFNGDRSLSSTSGGGTAMMGGAAVVRMGPGGTTSSSTPEKLTPEQQAERTKAAIRSSRIEISRLLLGCLGITHPALGAVEYTYAGEAQAPDGTADVIDVKNADGFAVRLFVDQRTHLPLVVTYQGAAPRIVTNSTPPDASGGSAVRTFSRQVGEAAPPASDAEKKKLSEEADKRMKELQTQPAPTVEIKMYFSDWSAVDGVQFPHKIQRATGDNPSEEWTISKVKVNQKVDAKKFQVKTNP